VFGNIVGCAELGEERRVRSRESSVRSRGVVYGIDESRKYYVIPLTSYGRNLTTSNASVLQYSLGRARGAHLLAIRFWI
jgi:hypothetical protein